MALVLAVSLSPTGVDAAVESGALLATRMAPQDLSSGAPAAEAGDSVSGLTADESAAPVLQTGKASTAVLKAADDKSASAVRQDDAGAIQPVSLSMNAGAAGAFRAAETAYPVDAVTAAHTRQFGPAKTASADVDKTATPAIDGADGHEKMPYALVLALFALIGLVPVSRRNH